MRRRSPTLALAATALVAVACEEPSAATTLSVERSDSAGIELVTITGDVSALPAWSLSEPIAVVSGEAEPFLTNVGEVELLSDGGFVVEDNRADQLHHFGPDASYRGRLGGQGDGPGEFQNVTELTVSPTDTLYAYDRVHDRLTVLHPEAGFVRTVSFLDAAGPRPPLDAWVLAPDRIASVAYDLRDDDTPMPRRGYTDLPVFLSDADADSLAGPFDVSGEFSTESDDFDALAPFSPRRAIAGVWGTLAFGGGDLYEFTVVDPDFRVVRRIRWARPRVPFSEEEISRVHTAIDRFYAGEDAPPELAEQMVRLRAAMKFPEMIPEDRPEVGAVLMDAGARIWVAAFDPVTLGEDDDPREWHVLAPDGEPLARVSLPAGTRLVAVGPDVVLLVRTDELDVEHLQLRRIVS